MKKLNEILQELGISKVKLAKYLGVSRQMIYNYLELENLNKWPKEKKVLLFKLLGIDDGDEKTLNNIKITTEYIMEVEGRLSQNIKETNEIDNLEDIRKLKKEEQQLYSDLTYIIKDKLLDTYKHDENIATLTYVYHLLQSADNVDAVKYILAYITKLIGFTNPNEFAYDEENQFMFEGIIHSAMTLYKSGGASKSRVVESRNRFVQEIERKKEEQLSRTQQLTTVKIQALKELGYTQLDNSNANEVFEKIIEIQSRWN